MLIKSVSSEFSSAKSSWYSCVLLSKWNIVCIYSDNSKFQWLANDLAFFSRISNDNTSVLLQSTKPDSPMSYADQSGLELQSLPWSSPKKDLQTLGPSASPKGGRGMRKGIWQDTNKSRKEKRKMINFFGVRNWENHNFKTVLLRKLQL